MSIYLSIKNSLAALIKGLYPTFDVFYEEMSKADEDGRDIENYFFVDIIPVGNSTMSEYHTKRNVLIDIACHTKEEQNAEYLIMADTIDEKIRPVFRFEDRAITITEASSRVVDKVLHYTFNINFVDSVEEPEQSPFMDELNATIKERV